MSFAPSGFIRDSLEIESDLASKYFAFLRKQDPIERWEDIAPLADAIPTKKNYEYDVTAVEHWASICPQLLGVASAQSDFDAAAPLLGYRYAWSRVQMHCRILNAIERWYRSEPLPKNIIEPGCFCSGLVHFLPTIHSGTYFGIDISPISLDVCRELEKRDGLQGNRVLLRADFQVINAQALQPHSKGGDVGKALVLISNILGSIQHSWDYFPAVRPTILTAWLVSYWTNLGATVVVCERNADPEKHLQFIQENGRWEGQVTSELLDDFMAIATTGICPSAPVGEWERVRTGISIYQPTK